jgi:hypothetical protein
MLSNAIVALQWRECGRLNILNEPPVLGASDEAFWVRCDAYCAFELERRRSMRAQTGCCTRSHCFYSSSHAARQRSSRIMGLRDFDTHNASWRVCVCGASQMRALRQAHLHQVQIGHSCAASASAAAQAASDAASQRVLQACSRPCPNPQCRSVVALEALCIVLGVCARQCLCARKRTVAMSAYVHIRSALVELTLMCCPAQSHA